MRTTTSGLLLFLIAAMALAGFLSGRLNDWLGYLFSPSTSSPSATASSATGLGSILPVSTFSQGAGVGLAGSYSTAKVG